MDISTDAKPRKQRRVPRSIAERRAKVAKLWDYGLCTAQIAERLLVTQNVVRLDLRVLKLNNPTAPHRYRYDGVGVAVRGNPK